MRASIDAAIEKYLESKSQKQAENYQRFYKLVANLAVINDDIAGYIKSLNQCKFNGYTQIIMYGNLLHKIFEAKILIFNKCNQEALILANSKSLEDEYKKQLKDLNAKYHIEVIEKFKEYRDTIGGHYDADICDLVIQLGKCNGKEILDLILNFQKYLNEYIGIIYNLGQSRA